MTVYLPSYRPAAATSLSLSYSLSPRNYALFAPVCPSRQGGSCLRSNSDTFPCKQASLFAHSRIANCSYWRKAHVSASHAHWLVRVRGEGANARSVGELGRARFPLWRQAVRAVAYPFGLLRVTSCKRACNRPFICLLFKLGRRSGR